MKRYFFFLLTAICLLCVSLDAAGKEIYPRVGKPCPDFILQNIEYFPKKKAALNDFKGKWLILDFWNKGCGSCVEDFPKTNEFQKKFANRVQFMLVGIQDKEAEIRTMYTKFKDLLHLVLPCAFDSSLSNLWGIYSCPHIIIIDDKGIVQGVTNDIESENIIQELLEGKHPVLPRTYITQNGDGEGNIKIPLDFSKPFLINGNGGKNDTDYIFRSVLAGWDSITQELANPVAINIHAINKSWRPGLFNVLGAMLARMYQYAYLGSFEIRVDDTTMYGKYWEKPILMTKDSLKFYRGHYYSYSMSIPPSLATTDKMKSFMQNDLRNYFNYEATMETRMMPVWKLVATDRAKDSLRTKGGSTKYETIIRRVTFRYQNISMLPIISLCVGASKGVVIDETGIKENIDILMNNCIDFDGVRQSLRENGLELVKGEKEMKVLVIRDPN